MVVPDREVYCKRHPYPEDIFLVVEYAIASSCLLTVLQEKRNIYASAGLQEYWVVDLKHRYVGVLRKPQDGTYQFDQILSKGTISPIAFPDITVKIERLL